MAEASSDRAVAGLSLVGQVRGEVRRLEAFDKKRHTVPDQVNAATQAFLVKLCEAELAEEAEELFQAARRHFGYKRKELVLNVGGGLARLDTPEFAFEFRYELEEEDPSSFRVESELIKVASRDLLDDEAFNATFGARFDRVRYRLRGRFSIETIIDSVEDDQSGEISVDYPSSCSHCEVGVEGVPGVVYLDGATLELRIGSLRSARDLLAAFEAAENRFGANEGLREVMGLLV